MQEEGLKTIQVPSVCPLSPDSPVSPQRHHHLSSGGYTTNQPASPKDILFSPEQEGQKQQVQATTKAKCLCLDMDLFYHLVPFSPSLLFCPIIPIPQRKLAQPLITPYLKDIPDKPPTDLLDLRRQLLLSFPKVAKPLSDP